MGHTPVLLQEVVLGLAPKAGEVILDATVGGGGHSEALCRAMEGRGTFVCLDEDEDAIERSQERLKECTCQFLFCRKNFRNLDETLVAFGISEINRVIFDLGLSSFQLEESGRGFSFQKDEPLQMTFQKIPPAVDGSAPFYKGRIEGGELTAEKIVNEWDEGNIRTILDGYGEERAARSIAAAIVRAREGKRITTTAELREIIERTAPRRGKIHPATKTFQALRMAVNDEFEALKEGLSKAWTALLPHGRVAVISFHSIEDRTVKDFFKALSREGTGKLVTKKPVTPAREEILANPRARSAKLRIIEKLK